MFQGSNGRSRRVAVLLFALLAAVVTWAVWSFQPPMWLFPLAVFVIFLFYTNTLLERVPLYLTNTTTSAALVETLKEHSPQPQHAHRPAFIDLGCGLGGTVAYIARQMPDWDVVGVETAPGSYLVAKLRTAGITNARVEFKSLWSVDLSAFDVAYAFLSPAPMARLLAKAKSEMPQQGRGAMFISNSFWADDVPFDGEIEVADARATRLIFSIF